MTKIGKQNNAGETEFRGKISRKLSVIFGILLFLVLLVGGSSLYLLRSVLLGAEQIEKESEQVAFVQDIHGTVHELISAHLRADVQQKTFSDSHRKTFFNELNDHLQHYREAAGAPEAAEAIGRIIADVASISERIIRQTQGSSRLPGRTMRLADLNALRDAEQRIQSIAESLSAAHETHEERQLRKNQGILAVMFGFYSAFVFCGVFLILGAGFLFSRRISQPLRSLAQCATDVARGNFNQKVPVSSKDEIGQLSHAFNFMFDKLKENEEKLKTMATLEERGRIAQELHDSLAQDLALLRLELIESERNLPITKITEVKYRIRDMRKIVERAYEDVREAIFGLRATVPCDLGLVPTLTQYLHKFREMRGIPVDLVIPNPEEVQLASHTQIQLIRIIHEALANVFKHAQATMGLVMIARDGSYARITIEDDGRGFVVDQAMEKDLHFGLQTMRERAEGVCGKLKIESAPGQGTKVIVYLPLEERPYEAYPLAVGG